MKPFLSVKVKFKPQHAAMSVNECNRSGEKQKKVKEGTCRENGNLLTKVKLAV